MYLLLRVSYTPKPLFSVPIIKLRSLSALMNVIGLPKRRWIRLNEVLPALVIQISPFAVPKHTACPCAKPAVMRLSSAEVPSIKWCCSVSLKYSTPASVPTHTLPAASQSKQEASSVSVKSLRSTLSRTFRPVRSSFILTRCRPPASQITPARCSNSRWRCW